MATQPPTDALPDPGLPPPQQDDADHIGSATMLPDGTLHLALRAVAEDGTIGEALLVVEPGDERYPGFVKHLGGLKPGQSCSIPPFA